jgi:hypothetical protein
MLSESEERGPVLKERSLSAGKALIRMEGKKRGRAWRKSIKALASVIRTLLKINLSAPACGANRFKMLTYNQYAPLSNRFAPCQEH